MDTQTFDVEAYLNRELLRLTTAGSVDDGKSTLIGRLLYDSKAIFQDQMEALEHTSRLRGEETVNLALLTDGLRSEREQGITIDVAYRYFSTPRRKFIIADTPGHEQYTRNMVTGASTSQLAIILIDARNGVLPQSRRHGIIASLLGIPHVVVAINKMDVVDWSEKVYNGIVREYTEFSEKLNIHDITFIPISALLGDNVVEKSTNMPWYEGPTVLHQLENVTIAADRNFIDFRFPVQYVVRPHQDFRGFAGRVASGTIRVGEPVIALPSMQESRIKEIITYDGTMTEALAGDSVILTIEDERDISRGDMIVRKNNVPVTSRHFEATICWMDDKKELKINQPYRIQHTTRIANMFIRKLRYQLDVNTLHRMDSETLLLNEIGRVEVESSLPVFYDPYKQNRETGGFIIIDPATNLTVGAGMILGGISKEEREEREERHKTPNEKHIKWEDFPVTQKMREEKNGHRAHCYWFTGLSGSGKSTIARSLSTLLYKQGKQVYVLDGDNVRHGLNADLGFSDEDRAENIRRVGHVARLLVDAGFIVICSFISPRQAMRDGVRALFPDGYFSEVFVKCDIDECRKRDPKGLYRAAEEGMIKNFTGLGSEYETPLNPDMTIDTSILGVDEAVEKLGRIIVLP
ncbi:MAG: sulfate adenylyltransferase subunit CysN [Spirochaetota bacterium]